MSATGNIYQRLNFIRSKVAYIKKDKAVENYKAVTHDAVVAETRQWFIEAGVMIVPKLVRDLTLDTGAKSSKGNINWRYEGTFDVQFVNCDEPDQVVTVTVTAHANDYGDKAPGKAITYATKTAILKVLYLETGENDEARQPMNAAPGDEVEDDELATMLTAIKGAETMDKLVETYKAAYARASKDREAQRSIVAAKDARKSELTGGKK